MTSQDAPFWMLHHMAVYSARTAHQFCAARMRRKLVNESEANVLLAEAFEMVRREIGSFPSEDRPGNDPHPDDDSTEHAMRQIAAENFEVLTETESYMWGLGIAGIFHLWEREARRVIQALDRHAAPEKLDKMDFKHLCDEIKQTGFEIMQHPSFPTLRLACLVANTIKHGRGRSFRDLLEVRRDLFQGGPVGVRMGNLAPEPHHLRVSESEFDAIVAGIDKIWLTYENVALARP